MSEAATCELCGEPMPAGEQMFKFHGYSGPCPKPPLSKPKMSIPTDEQIAEFDAAEREFTEADTEWLKPNPSETVRQRLVQAKEKYDVLKDGFPRWRRLLGMVAELRRELGREKRRADLAVEACDQARATGGRVADERDNLAAFKSWVHGWLDAHGVPADPLPEKTAETGCRISGRMEWLWAKYVAAAA